MEKHAARLRARDSNRVISAPSGDGEGRDEHCGDHLHIVDDRRSSRAGIAYRGRATPVEVPGGGAGHVNPGVVSFEDNEVELVGTRPRDGSKVADEMCRETLLLAVI